MKHRKFRPYEAAAGFIRVLELRSMNVYWQWCKGELKGKPPRPADIPTRPDLVYKGQGWESWGQYLGTGFVATSERSYRPFKAARRHMHGLKLRSQRQWRAWCRGELPGLPQRPPDIPPHPNVVYMRQGWQGFGDWLGTGNRPTHGRVYRPFNEARAFVRKLKLKNHDQWIAYGACGVKGKPHLPKDIPRNPKSVYGGQGWKNLGDWLGTGQVSFAERSRSFRPFADARRYVRRLKLRNQQEWREWCRGALKGKPKRPMNIPASPHTAYQHKGWGGYGDWLGTGAISTRLRIYRPFEEARRFVRSLDLKDTSEWHPYCAGELRGKGTKPSDIPANPQNVYADAGWKGWRDWLREEGLSSKWRGFADARDFVRGLGLRNRREYLAYATGRLTHKKPVDLPVVPNGVYEGKGWISWGDFLGTGNVAPRMTRWRPFPAAREFARNLGLQNVKEWMRFCRGLSPEKGSLPRDIPSNPALIYLDAGWSGWEDWLGMK